LNLATFHKLATPPSCTKLSSQLHDVNAHTHTFTALTHSHCACNARDHCLASTPQQLMFIPVQKSKNLGQFFTLKVKD